MYNRRHREVDPCRTHLSARGKQERLCHMKPPSCLQRRKTATTPLHLPSLCHRGVRKGGICVLAVSCEKIGCRVRVPAAVSIVHHPRSIHVSLTCNVTPRDHEQPWQPVVLHLLSFENSVSSLPTCDLFCCCESQNPPGITQRPLSRTANVCGWNTFRSKASQFQANNARSILRVYK